MVEGMRSRVSWTAIAVAIALSAGVGWVVAKAVDGSRPQPVASVTFTGRVTSMYADGTGGCVDADHAVAGVGEGPDDNCGPFYLAVGTSQVHLGDRVRATEFQTEASDGEDVSGLLVSRATSGG
jgi:hypothetical protein